MAYWDERPCEPLRLPHPPAIAPSARDRERFDPRASTRFREHGASAVGRLVRSQDLESAGLTKVVKCAASAVLPPPPRRSSVDVVTPLPTPMLVKHRSQLNKVCSMRRLIAGFLIQ